jgi:hypothetical protein
MKAIIIIAASIGFGFALGIIVHRHIVGAEVCYITDKYRMSKIKLKQAVRDLQSIYDQLGRDKTKGK